MFRKDLIELLLQRPTTLYELAQELEAPLKEVEADLQHLLKSLHHLPYRAEITPARCNKCGFVFRHDKLHKPSRCPRCRGNWISAPRISITPR